MGCLYSVLSIGSADYYELPDQDLHRLRTAAPVFQRATRGRRLVDGQLSRTKLRSYCRSPVPPKWRIVPRPNWQDQPYFTHRNLPLVTSINILDAHAPGRRKHIKRIAIDIEEAFADLVALLGPLPDDCEVLFHRIGEGIDEDGEDGMEYWKEKDVHQSEGLDILVVDHRQRVVSLHRRRLQHDLVTASSEVSEKAINPIFESTVLNTPSSNSSDASIEARYWNYVSRYPHFYTDHPKKADKASREAGAIATTLLLKETC
ncbi:hypothetical protein FRC04_010135 [Tulasnella sp. 424]|nr:hypothetical protein FRC04_010135 [Tulasnella sp. 424]KAG8972542.1 hypothetical protein FRC05_009775 [Tulasnella sp. 425]